MVRFVDNTRAFTFAVKQLTKAQVRGAGGRYVSAGSSSGSSAAHTRSGTDGIVSADHIDVASTAAFKRAASDKTYARNMSAPEGDLFMHDLAHEMGYDAKPQVVSKAALDAHIAAGELELVRGVSEPRFAQQFQTGDLFAGRGAYGNGTYTAHGDGALHTAIGYAQGSRGAVLRMSLKKGAKVADYDTLRAEMTKTQIDTAGKIWEARDAGNKGLAEQLMAKITVLDDMGRYAMSLGYDAINEASSKYLVLLNRSAVRVQKEFVS